MLKSRKPMMFVFWGLLLAGALLLTAPTAHAALSWTVPNPFSFNVSGENALQVVVANLINIAFMAAGIVAVIYLIIGGFRYVTSSGNAEQTEAAKMTIMNAIIGLIVIFISFLIVNYILGAVGVRNTFFTNPSSTGGGGLFR